MQLVIQANGMEAFPIKQVFEIWANQWPDPGQVLPVTFDREHHDRIKIHWDQVATSSETAAMDAEALAAQLNAAAGGSGAAGTAAPRPPVAFTVTTPPQSAPADPVDRLAKLADLHKAGALTDEEFAAEKEKILKSM